MYENFQKNNNSHAAVRRIYPYFIIFSGDLPFCKRFCVHHRSIIEWSVICEKRYPV